MKLLIKFLVNYDFFSQVCLPSCPSDKQVIKESNCGKAKIACCVTGKKKLCCPKSMGNIDPALAEAIAE